MNDELLSELNQTLRKQGRAAVAAQAAAEESLESLKRLEAKLDGPNAFDLEEAVRMLLPFVDAVDRVAAEARRLEAAPTGVIARTFDRTRHAESRALARAVGLLVTQIEGVLDTWDVEIDRATGVPLDTERHRVVETRPGPGAQMVLEIVRPGCMVRGRRIREADVVITGGSHG